MCQYELFKIIAWRTRVCQALALFPQVLHTTKAPFAIKHNCIYLTLYSSIFNFWTCLICFKIHSYFFYKKFCWVAVATACQRPLDLSRCQINKYHEINRKIEIWGHQRGLSLTPETSTHLYPEQNLILLSVKKIIMFPDARNWEHKQILI